MIERTNRSANAFKLGDRGGKSNDLDALADENAAECVGIFHIPIKNQVSLTVKEPVIQVGEIARDLHHSSVVGMRSDTRDLHGAGGDIDEEQDVVSDQTGGSLPT